MGQWEVHARLKNMNVSSKQFYNTSHIQKSLRMPEDPEASLPAVANTYVQQP